MSSLRARMGRLEARPPEQRYPQDLLDDVAGFTATVGSSTLRPYQRTVAETVLDSVRTGRGDVISVMMARQMGKNQTSAALEYYLLNLFAGAGGQIVKAAPTFKPQIINSMLRLRRELEGPYTAGRSRPVFGYGLQLGRARILFFSAEKGSNVVGATADILLEIDEAQDVDETKYLQDFRPMASTTNATTVLYGTAWTEDCLLEKTRRHNLELEERDGRRRHFEFDWTTLAALNPAYKQFVSSEIARMGIDHPVVRTQYLLHAVPGLGKFLSVKQRELLRGRHERLRAPEPGSAGSGPSGHGVSGHIAYVAGVDVAGEDEEASDAALRALKPRRDSTVVTIGRIRWNDEGEVGVDVVEHYWWTGRDHQTQLQELERLTREVWHCRRVVVDATGVGAGLASWLERTLGDLVVEQFMFSAPSKSRLGFQLLEMINTGRCSVYKDGGEEAAELWGEVGLARYEMRENNQLRWYVAPHEGHDDFLVSLALCCQAAQGAVRRAADAVIRPRRIAYGD